MKKIEITVDEYKRLLRSDLELQTLDDAGVEDWEGYENAFDYQYLQRRQKIEKMQIGYEVEDV